MPVSEDTINDLVADYLRGEFDVDITTQPTGQIPAGRRKPDFELHWDGKTYFGEGEWLSSYGRGLQQALDFGEIPGASGWFLLGYPDEIKREVTQRRLGSADPATLLEGLTFRQCLLKGPGTPADLRQVRVEDLHAWIGSVLAARPSAPEPTEFIRLMHYVVGNLATFLPKTKGAARLFEHVVAMIPSKKDEEDAARTGAAYLLLNQLVFYRLLAGHTELGWPQMEPRSVKSPLDVKVYFDRVMQQDYHAIFKTNVIDLFPQRTFPFIQSLIKLVSELQPEAFTRTLLGTIFHQLIPEPVRKPVAAFYTQPPAARLLVGLAGVHGSDRVSDFACGSGTLLVAAYEAKSETDSRPNSQSRHATYLEEELTGIDIMPFAAHLAVVQLALMNPTQWTNRVQVAVDNSLEKRVGDVVRSLERHAVSPQTRLSHFAEEPEERVQTVRGAVSTNGAGSQFKLVPPQIVLMNPPFSRKQFISKEYRKELATSFVDEAKFHRNDMGYWGYFVLLADRFLPDGGKLALVISAALLREGSSASIREMLRSKYRIDYIVMSASRTAFSEDASFPDFLLVATKTTERSKPCRVAMLHAPLELERVDWLRTRIETGETAPEVTVATLAQDRFSADDWLPLVPGAVPDESSILLPKSAPVCCRLGSVSGLGLIQGVRMESGSEFANPADMLISSERSYQSRADWKTKREDARVVVAFNPEGAREVTIPRQALLPALRTISGSRRLEVRGRPPDYVVAERFPHDTEFWVTKNPEGMLIRRRNTCGAAWETSSSAAMATSISLPRARRFSRWPRSQESPRLGTAGV